MALRYNMVKGKIDAQVTQCIMYGQKGAIKSSWREEWGQKILP